MTGIRKVPFGAGAEWVLGGFALLRRAPLALGLLGLIWGCLSAAASLSGIASLNLLLGLAGPLLFGGVVYAAREVDQGRPARPAHLVQGMREHKLPRLLAMLLPQVVALLVMATLLIAMVGAGELERMAAVMLELQTNPDPALVESLPLGRLTGWLLVSLVVGLVAGLFTFVAIPEVMFSDRGAFAAMGLSLRVCLRNLGAIIVMAVLALISVFAISLVLQLGGAVLGLLVGAQAAMLLVQLLLMAVLVPLLAGMVYHAWRQLVGEAGTAGPPPRPAGNFEA